MNLRPTKPHFFPPKREHLGAVLFRFKLSKSVSQCKAMQEKLYRNKKKEMCVLWGYIIKILIATNRTSKNTYPKKKKER